MEEVVWVAVAFVFALMYADKNGNSYKPSLEMKTRSSEKNNNGQREKTNCVFVFSSIFSIRFVKNVEQNSEITLSNTL